MIGWFLFKEKTAYELSIRDWSSDVCSSDRRARRRGQRHGLDDERQQRVDDLDGLVVRDADVGGIGGRVGQAQVRSGHDWSSGSRSEERRVGKEWVRPVTSWWSPAHSKKNAMNYTMHSSLPLTCNSHD